MKAGPASPSNAGSYDALGRVSALVSVSARLGLLRLYAPFEGDGLPPRSQEEVRANIATADNLRSTIDEYIQANTSMRQAASLHDFTDKPLVVLTAGIGNGPTHTAEQNDLATLSTNSVHHVIDDATHEALVADKEQAAATTGSILDVVSAVRSNRTLDR